MEQKENKYDPAKEYARVSDEYCRTMRDYISGIEAKLKEVSEHMDMNDPFHADALRSFTWGLVAEVEKETKKIGRHYETEVRNIRNIVVGEQK